MKALASGNMGNSNTVSAWRGRVKGSVRPEERRKRHEGTSNVELDERGRGDSREREGIRNSLLKLVRALEPKAQ
jgi:hypothetical protein